MELCVELYPRIKTGVRVFVAGVALTACSGSLQMSETPSSLPRPASHVAPSHQDLDQCKTHEDLAPIEDFNGLSLYAEGEETSIWDEVEYLNVVYPNSTPRELAEHYIELRNKNLEAGLKIALDPSVTFGNWHTIQPDGPTDDVTDEKITLVREIGSVFDTLSTYPAGIFPKLGVHTIRLDDSGDENYYGYYDAAAGEIKIEFHPQQMEVPTFDEKDLYLRLTHELAHAIHNHLCGGYSNEDLTLAGRIRFIDYADPKSTPAEFKHHYAQVPKESYAYGPERIFVEDYSATNVKEYFATLTEYTIEERGLILPVDKDYGSILQKNQELVVQRLEELFPGFEKFIKFQTGVLRLKPSNEIYMKDKKEITYTQKQWQDLAAKANPALVLNGMVFEQDNYRRSDAITLYPRIRKDGLTLQQDDLGYNGIVLGQGSQVQLLVFKGQPLITHDTEVTLPATGENSILPRQTLLTTDASVARAFEAHELENLELVTITIKG